MIYSSRLIANRAVFDDVAKPRILKRGRPNLQLIYKKYFVPAFQREYVWKRADAKNLISSLINESFNF